MPEVYLSKEDNVISADEQERIDTEKIKTLKDYKKRFEPRWYLVDAFWEGFHFTYGTKDKDGNWLRVPTPKGKTIREIPKAKKQLLSVRNMILKVKQRPVVYPDRDVLNQMTSKEEKEKAELEAKRKGYYLGWKLNEDMKLGRHLKKLVRFSGMYNAGYIQILNDGDKKEFAVYDPFDISVYPTISNINDYPCLNKHISIRKRELEQNEVYDQTIVSGLLEGTSQGKFSDNMWKQQLMSERYGRAPTDLIPIDEFYEIVEDTAGEKQLVIKTYLGNRQIRLKPETNLTKIPISMFCWSDEALQTSFFEDIMPINKAYDIIISKLEQKAKKLDTGRIIMQKGEDAKVLTTNDGEIIRWKKFRPEVMQEASVPNAFMEYVARLENDLKEQGVSVAAMTNLPAGVKAWRAIETLKESDYASIGTQMDNLNECMVDITEKLIEMEAADKTVAERVQIPMEKGEADSFQVIGQAGADIYSELTNNQPIPEDTVVISDDMILKVEIETDLAYTEQAKKDNIMEMVGAGIVPIEVAIDLLNVGNTKEIMDKLKEQMTMGKSMIDMPDFQVLPRDLQQAIVKYLTSGASEGMREPGPETNAPPQRKQ
jgi:hypothetical protein